MRRISDFCQVKQVSSSKSHSKEIMSETVMKAEQELFLVERVGMKIIGGRLASFLNMGIKGYGQIVEQV